jgi:glycosyltransferase involved in cell wall biosynthesis
MKVMFLIPHVSGGGGERVLSELSSSLGDETVLVVFEEKFSYPFKGRLISLKLPINRRSLLSRFTGFVRRAYRFRRLLGEERPNVVISFMGEANVINALVSPRPVLTVHNHLTALSAMRNRLEAFAVDTLNKALYKRATVVAVSQSIKSDLVENFRMSADRVVVIPNAVNSANVQEMSAESVTLPWNPGIPVVITAGRLSREKGQSYLIRAFAEVRKKMPCQLAILGTGDLEDPLKRLTSELGIEKDVYFLGWQSNPFKYIAKATVFVSPSLTEGFGLALLEAMACKVPVIATDCPGGQREIIKAGECGLLVPPASETHLADAIVKMLTDTELRSRYVNAGLKRVEDFDPTRFQECYLSLLAPLRGAGL